MRDVFIELMDKREYHKGGKVFSFVILEPKMPHRAHATDAGIDLYAPEAITLFPNLPTFVGLAFKMQLPSQHFAMVTPRSGLAHKHGLTVLNSPGIIDEHYRDEVGVLMFNTGKDEYDIKLHERIAQMIVLKLPYVKFRKGRINDESRGGGLGSSGRF